MAITQSPLSIAANNIVTIGNRNQRALPKAQREFQDFSRFLEIEILKLERQQLPDKRKIKNLANINIVSSFGSAGNLLQNLLGGALDLGGFISGMFPGKGEKVGKSPNKSRPQPNPTVRGGKLRLGGIRALGIANAVFAGLDFATGLAEGESVGKAASGAVGSFGGALAGSLLAGALGQALIPVPGVGFVIGMVGGAAGGFLGGYGADRAYEAITGDTKQKQEQQLKTQEEKQKAASKKPDVSTQSFSEVLMKFNEAVIKFEDFSMNIGSLMGNNVDNPYNEPTEYPDFPDVPSNETYDGPVDGDTFFPLPGGDVGTRGTISPGQAFGAPRDGGARQHAGLDMTHHKGALDAPVVAYKSGRVIWASPNGSYNSGVMIDHGNGMKTKYFHITPLVKQGDIVYGGQQIAKLFPAGQSTHLHFEVHKGGTPINPLNAGVGPGGSAKRLPAPLSVDKAKENSLKNSSNTDITQQSSGINLYLPQQSQTKPQTSTTPQIASTQSQQKPITQPLPKNVMLSPPKQERQIEIYPSYSQGQSYIMEKQTIISNLSPGGGGSQRPMMIPVGGGGGGQSIVISPETGSLVLNSLMKSILLTSLSST
jgi:murein DD-endopeptidase MepM/ murein hydrolase activator NlpD